MIDLQTALSLALGVVAVVDHLLSFTPKGYPKSLIQGIIWIGHKIYCLFTRKCSNKVDDESDLIDVSI